MLRNRVAVGTVICSLGLALAISPAPASADTSDQLQAQLDAANATLSGLYSQAEEASEKVNETQTQLDETKQEIEQKEKDLSVAQDVLAARVSSNYKTGGVSLVTILFESSNFDDLVSRIYYASKVSASDASVIQEVKDIKTELDAKKTEQEQLLEEQKEQQAALDSAVSESESYVSSLSAELQEALAAEQAAREAEQAAAAAAAAEAAAANEGNYVDGTTNEAQQNQDNQTAQNENNSNSNSNSNSNTSDTSNNNSSSGSLTQAQRNAIVSAAWAKVGCSYVYGASGPSSYDCSGFTQYCYAAAGISLPRSSYSQGGCGSATSNPQAGDLVCWGGHVGIYLGGGMMIDAGNPSVGVSYRAVYGSPWYRTF